MMAGVVVIAASVSYTLAQEDDGQPQPPEYVGARQCFACHRDVGPTHFESPHALTLRPAEPDAILADFEQGQEERVIQLPGEDEARPFTVDDIAYVVGVGQYMQQYVVEAGSEDEGDAQLLVLPVVWDVDGQTWHRYPVEDEAWPSAGHDFVESCAGCHVTGLSAGGEDERWIDDGVQCEACHGPGSAHIEAVRDAGSRNPEGEALRAVQESIVLSPDAQICGQCHSQGSAPDGHPYPIGYRPGENLLSEDVFTLVPPDESSHWWPTNHGMRKYMQFNEWLYFGHAGALDSLRDSGAARDACLVCHSVDYAWAQSVETVPDTEAAEAEAAEEADEGEGETEESAAPQPVTVNSARFGVTCVSCHTIHAADATEDEDDQAEGQTAPAEGDPTYALCVECHNDTDVTPWIHHPVQEMYEGIAIVDEVNAAPSPHFVVPGGPTCSTCHMPRVPIVEFGTRASHSFQPIMPGAAVDLEQVQDSCSGCHGDTVDAPTMQRLIDDIQANTQARLDAIQGNIRTDHPDWVRLAVQFVAGDGSLGIHNYRYSDALLDAVEAELGLDQTDDEQAAEAQDAAEGDANGAATEAAGE